MKNNINKLVLLTFVFLFSIVVSSCKKEEFENKKTLKQLYRSYKNGEISECMHNGQKVYSAGLNAYDASSFVYDKNRKEIGACNYAWGNVDAICKELTDCEVVYRVKNNIWGLPAVDKYGLGK